jgi:hypothetical protein
MAARSWVPGLSAVVWTENGGPLSPDQFSRRQVTATAIRAPFGHAKLFDFSVMTDISTIRCQVPPPFRAALSLEHFHADFAAATSRAFVAVAVMAYDCTVLQEAAAWGRRP